MTVEEKIEKVLNRVRPYLQNDGGDVEFIKYEKKTISH
jgi:Fe-S cluster biogenesis protein NfuA